jgi:hypothetical protein
MEKEINVKLIVHNYTRKENRIQQCMKWEKTMTEED